LPVSHLQSHSHRRNAIYINGMDDHPWSHWSDYPMRSTIALTAATVIKLPHMPLQAGIPDPARGHPLLSVQACFSMTVPEALNSTID